MNANSLLAYLLNPCWCSHLLLSQLSFITLVHLELAFLLCQLGKSVKEKGFLLVAFVAYKTPAPFFSEDTHWSGHIMMGHKSDTSFLGWRLPSQTFDVGERQVKSA